MPIADLVVEIDKEVARLLAARKLLAGEAVAEVKAGKRGGYVMSAATRKKLSRAQKARWRAAKAKA